jgi:hypothetical protein
LFFPIKAGFLGAERSGLLCLPEFERSGQQGFGVVLLLAAVPVLHS